MTQHGSIDAARILVGLAGRGIMESRTPRMHEAEGDFQGLRMVYSLFDFTARGWTDDQLPRLLDAAQMLGFAGLNITFPFKQAVLPHLDTLSDQATTIGAVNTVSFADGKRTGFNTDVTGFAAAFATEMAGVARGSILQLGCGGAGAATAHALLGGADNGIVYLYDNDAERAERLAAQLAAHFGVDRVALSLNPEQTARQVDGILNATPIGMAKSPGSPIAPEAIEARHWVADVIYFPLQTELLRMAAAKGCRTMNGGGMAVQQAADAFHIFTGLAASPARMRGSFDRFKAAV